MDKPAFNKLEKGLQTRFNNAKFTTRNDQIKSFLRDFTKTVNNNNLSLRQAITLFLGFFAGPLETLVERKIERNGLQAAVDFVRRYKTNSLTVDDYREQGRSFKLSKKDPKDSMFTLFTNLTLGHPSATDESILLSFKRAVMEALPDQARREVIKMEKEARMNRFEEMSFDEFMDAVDAIMKTSTATANHVEARPLPDTVLTKDMLPDIIRTIDNVSFGQQQQMQSLGQQQMPSFGQQQGPSYQDAPQTRPDTGAKHDYDQAANFSASRWCSNNRLPGAFNPLNRTRRCGMTFSKAAISSVENLQNSNRSFAAHA